MANDYGIRFGNLFHKSEWKAIKTKLEQLDKNNDNFALTKADYTKIKESIKTGNLGAYMDSLGDEMKNALGLALKGKVDDLDAAQRLTRGIKLENADLDKVLKYIANAKDTPKNTEVALETMADNLVGNTLLKTGNVKVDGYTKILAPIFAQEQFINYLERF